MKVFFEAEVPSYFSAYKLTLVPGENAIPKNQEDDMKALVAAHAQDCTRGASKDKVRLRILDEKKPAGKVVTSATPPSPKTAIPKKGAK